MFKAVKLHDSKEAPKRGEKERVCTWQASKQSTLLSLTVHSPSSVKVPVCCLLLCLSRQKKNGKQNNLKRNSIRIINQDSLDKDPRYQGPNVMLLGVITSFL